MRQNHLYFHLMIRFWLSLPEHVAAFISYLAVGITPSNVNCGSRHPTGLTSRGWTCHSYYRDLGKHSHLSCIRWWLRSRPVWMVCDFITPWKELMRIIRCLICVIALSFEGYNTVELRYFNCENRERVAWSQSPSPCSMSVLQLNLLVMFGRDFSDSITPGQVLVKSA